MVSKLNEYTVIIVGGFGVSGSSAVVDLLREFDTFQDFGNEFRLLVDPDGIMNLEDALVNSWTPYQSDIAIKRFTRLIGWLNNKNSYPYFNVDHSQALGDQFERLSNEYVNSLVSFTYNGMWLGIRDRLYVVGRRMNNRIFGKDLFRFHKPIHVAFLQGERFISITRTYLDQLINSCIDDTVKNVIIDEGFASLNPSRILNYFDSAKMIIIHRDPRDTYVDAMKSKFEFVPRDVDCFVKWYEYMQIQSERMTCDDNQIMRIQFEDLALGYEKTLKEIVSFLGIDDLNHTRKKVHFDPGVSIRNIGLWKMHENQEEIERIFSRLAKYCHNNHELEIRDK